MDPSKTIAQGELELLRQLIQIGYFVAIPALVGFIITLLLYIRSLHKKSSDKIEELNNLHTKVISGFHKDTLDTNISLIRVTEKSNDLTEQLKEEFKGNREVMAGLMKSNFDLSHVIQNTKTHEDFAQTIIDAIGKYKVIPKE